MRQMVTFLLRSFIVIMILFLQPVTISADWINNFVVYDGNSYTITDKEIQSDSIGKRLGEVTRYSDREGTYHGNFSNTYPKGTQYYAIEGANKKSKIAVKTPEGRYILATYSGNYPTPSLWSHGAFWLITIMVVLCIMIIGTELAHRNRNTC
ncbi:hypothetical protein I6N90_18410 [Paenibacillus sp. GSMTC-2017]|uniref:hypothetical protein n=1 Tax=Paenibacillus sp. GSMTC-2017 TaxID=2794350 RepID=UPI0018D90DB4|nr:hypothetical protein [Paenibacillus sp. GSMTC-2017]MBH5319775.1 hypothetical protein [Paenibacillus sp. GSMTC-2017]